MALRSPLTVQPYDYIADSNGRPLDYGQVYIGVANQDPEFYQIPVYLDAAMTKPIDQPIRTNDGFVDFAGSLSELYASAEVYSVKVLDKQGRKVLYKGDMTRKNLMSDALADLNQSIIDMQTAAKITLNAAVNSANTEVAQTVSSATAAIDTATTKSNKAATDADAAIKTLFENGGLPARLFETYAKMTAPDVDPPLVDGDYAVVTNDGDLNKNGVYLKQDGEWLYAKYNPKQQVIAGINNAQNTLSNVFVKKNYYVTIDDTIIAMLDANGNKTWLQASKDDGGLTADAENAVRNKLGLTKSIGGDIFAVTDSVGNYTDLRLNSDGEIHDAVMDNWRERLGSTSSTAINGKVLVGGQLVNMMPDKNKLTLIGSSSLGALSSYIIPKIKAFNPSITAYTVAFGGSIMENQNVLLGIEKLKLNITGNTIPTSGSVAATVTNNLNVIKDKMTMQGYINGVHGTIKTDDTGYFGSLNVTFTRTTAGSAVTVTSGVEFVPALEKEYQDTVQILWIGKNNLVSGLDSFNNFDALMTETDALINYSKPLVKKVVIMTHFVNTNSAADAPSRARIYKVNAAYKEKYGDMVFDANAIITGAQIFTDLGLKRTAEDIAQQNLGNKPPSLSADDAHLNTVANTYIAQKLADFIATKNWY